MFKTRKWIIISVLAAAIVVSVGILGGAAYAKSSTAAATTQTDPQKVLADKVAVILGLDTTTVEAAFTQAQKEMMTERSAQMLTAQEARIDKLVIDGKLTADEAAKYKTWLESKPSVVIPGLGQNGGFGRANCGPGGMRGFGRGLPPANSTQPAVTPDSTTTN